MDPALIQPKAFTFLLPLDFRKLVYNLSAIAFSRKVTLATHNPELASCASGSGQGGRALQVQNSGGDAFQILR